MSTIYSMTDFKQIPPAVSLSNFSASEDGEVDVVLASTQVEDWGVKAVHAEKAWKRTRGEGIKVAVLDTGVDASHPDLAPNMGGVVGNMSEGHATHVAGIIGAVDNAFGVVGVAPGCTLLSYQCLPGNSASIAQMLMQAVRDGADVVNMSLGAYGDDEGLHDAIKAAWGAGVVLVAAAGNDPTRISYPAAYPEVIAVSAVDENGKRAEFAPVVSNHVALPGVDLLSTWPGNQYARLSGTSMACPVLTGIIALMLGLFRPTRDVAVATVQEQLMRIDARADDFHFMPHLEML